METIAMRAASPKRYYTQTKKKILRNKTFVGLYLQFVINVFWFRHSESFLKFAGDLSSINSRVRGSTYEMKWDSWYYVQK